MRRNRKIGRRVAMFLVAAGLFAAIEASATGVSIGASYLFHRYGHHKLERWTSIIHIGLATTGSVRNHCLKTAHFTVAPGSTQ